MKQNIKRRPFLSLALQLQYSPLIKLFLSQSLHSPYHEPSPPFCHEIASPYFLLAFFGFGLIEFGEK